jgi:hypothetical protein
MTRNQGTQRNTLGLLDKVTPAAARHGQDEDKEGLELATMAQV